MNNDTLLHPVSSYNLSTNFLAFSKNVILVLYNSGQIIEKILNLLGTAHGHEYV